MSSKKDNVLELVKTFYETDCSKDKCICFLHNESLHGDKYDEFENLTEMINWIREHNKRIDSVEQLRVVTEQFLTTKGLKIVEPEN
jgi:hypothetical protein